MSEAAGKRLLTEMKQSPMKAAVLGAGILAAAVVWGPRLAGGSAQKTAPPVTAPNGDPADRDADLAGSSIQRRDPASIRSEFIRISEEARNLRRVADPIEMPAVEFDPFAAALAVPPLEVAVEGPPAEDVFADEERSLAAGHRLEGVIQFTNGCSVILDGIVLGVGEEHEGFTVVAIDGRSVVLRGRYAEYRLGMEDEKER